MDKDKTNDEKKYKILFLESSTGGGHISITTAIIQELQKKTTQRQNYTSRYSTALCPQILPTSK